VFGDDFKPHIHALLPTLIDKMGDIHSTTLLLSLSCTILTFVKWETGRER
jgi:hypothetical protein